MTRERGSFPYAFDGSQVKQIFKNENMITKKQAQKLLLQLSVISKIDILLKLKERGKMSSYQFSHLQSPIVRKKLKLYYKALQRGLLKKQGINLSNNKPYAIIEDSYVADRAVQDFSTYFKAEIIVTRL